MATQTTGTLGDSQEYIVDSGRIIREFEGVCMRTCDVQRLPDNTGLAWDELSFSALNAQAITESTELENPQNTSDTLLSVIPVVSGIQTRVTDRVYRRLSKKAIAQIGELAANALARKRDEDYLAVFAGATTTLSGTGTTMSSGIISAAVARIRGNATERSVGNIAAVLHGFVIKDIQDEITAGVGTYTIPQGFTDEIFKKGMMGIDRVSSAAVFEDGNITINATPDARGAVHSREAVILVQGHDVKTEKRRRPEIGGGADEVFMYDEYAYGERSAGNWLYGVLTDATAPTS